MRLSTLAITGAAVLAPLAVNAQTAQHKHYEDSPQAHQAAPGGHLAPRLQNLGSHTFKVGARSREAQRFFDQGINLAYGFNHAEAGRAFREAARLDPQLAMAYWGQALVLGPNINVPMNPEDEPKAFELAQKAMSLRGKASGRERAYIEALAVRYTGKAEDRARADRAYAEAMRGVSRRHPDDLDAATLFAEALMDLRPWAYWMADGTPYAETSEALPIIERVLARNPKHPGANHFYIHLVEAVAPQRAEAAADRLLPLMPGAGHMVHMPSHIFMRVGRYADASASNEKAVAADEDYIAQCRAQGIYPLGYYPHNIHFLWSSSTMEGRSRTAIDAAKKVAAGVADAQLAEMPFLAGFRVVPYYALARFGQWDEVLALPEPDAKQLYLRGTWHYVRGLALGAKGRLPEAEIELAHVRAIAQDEALEFALFSPNLASAIFALAPEALAADIAARRGDFDAAVAHLDRAVRLEDGLVYTEPAEWHYPVRQMLGDVLLQAGRPAEAVTVYADDLRRNPENGWSLFGLAKAYRALKRDTDAELVEARFRKAWAKADVTLTASRF